MDIRVLQYFLAVAREQSISGAAEALHMTQPPLSKQLKALEDELGKQLFVRGSRHITLTREGVLLRRRAEEIVALMERTRDEIRTADEAVTGDVYIGGGETEGMRVVAQAVQRVRATHPGLRFHFLSGDGYDVTERLDRGLIDFGTLIEPVDLSRYDSIRLPRPDVWGVMVRRDSPLAACASVRPDDLRRVPVIFSRQLAQENGLSGWLGCDYEQLNVVCTGNLVGNLLLLAEEGVGAVLTLDGLSLPARESLVFRPLEPRLVSWMHLVWKKYQVFSGAAEVFLRTLREQLAQDS